jgi:hypothetical protein
MKGRGDGEESLAEQIKGRPEQQHTHQDLDEAKKPNQPVSPDRLHTETSQAGSADDSVVVFADAFPAEGAPTFRAPCNGFTKGVVETTLLGYIHASVLPLEF